MKSALFEMAYYETYYLANIISNILIAPDGYLMNFNNWCGDDNRSILYEPYPRQSRLHGFTISVLNGLLDEEVSDVSIDSVVHDRKYEVWVDRALHYYGLPCSGFRKWLKENGQSIKDATEDDLYEYHSDLSIGGPLDELFERMSNEVFHVLFLNRELLLRFNYLAAIFLENADLKDLDPEERIYFRSTGILHRTKIPEWVRKAVFFRDRGHCVLCDRDITGLVSLRSEKHFDHMIPLSQGGLNDITNIQLVCEPCNLRKGGRHMTTSGKYQRWY